MRLRNAQLRLLKRPLLDPLRRQPRYRAIKRALKFHRNRDLSANASTHAASITALDLSRKRSL